MVSIPHSRFPRLVEGIDLRGLPIGPREAFVLSRIDGETSEFDIAEAAGIDAEAISATLDQLLRLGAIRFDVRQTGEPSRTPRPPARPSGASRLGPIIEAVGASQQQHPAAALYDPRELAEAVDLDEPRKRTILEAFHRLDSVTHYQLLHVDPSADKRTIKNAYYEIVNVFHPDRYFGKSLGSFKPKLERVFTRLTEAYDVLTRAAPRAEYDAYLASLHKTRDFDQRLSDSALKAQIQAIKQQIEEEARALERAQMMSSPSLAPGPSRADGPVSINPARMQTAPPTQAPSSRPLDSDARKRALARKLGGRSASDTQAPAPSIVPPTLSSEARERAAESLKRRYEQRILQAREQRAERYLVSAREAITAKDAASAANALRIAVSLVPGSPELGARLQEAQTEAEALLSNHYLTQAQYEERDGRLAEAARSYARAAVGNPSARVFERAAHCGLMAASDLRLAGEHARRAVALAAPDEETQARVTLARIYIGAGMKQSALAEFERAATLSPNDDTIQGWIRRIKRGEA